MTTDAPEIIRLNNKGIMRETKKNTARITKKKTPRLIQKIICRRKERGRNEKSKLKYF